MRLPLDLVLRRGVVFLWTHYDRLDDPKLAGRTKAKYAVILSGAPQDDPIVYLLTTSEKAKHASHPFPDDLQRLPAGSYEFLTLDTVLDAGDAGQLEVGREQFVALYESGEAIYKGTLADSHMAELVEKILASPRVSRRFKRILTGA